MRPTLWVMLTLVASAGLSGSPAYAQFAAEDPAELTAEGDGTYDETHAAAAPYAETDPVDPYAADPYGTAHPQSVGDRSVADVATSLLGAKGAQRVQDAETIVRTVVGRVGGKGGTPGSADADPVGLVQDILTAARKKKVPQ